MTPPAPIFCPNEPFPTTYRGRYHCKHDQSLWPYWGFGCEFYWELFDIQGGCCPACGEPWVLGVNERRPDIDHNHVDGLFPRGFIRGLPCGPCNRLLNETVVRIIEERGVEEELVLSGGDVVTARQAAYVLDPPGVKLWHVVPEELLRKKEKLKEKRAEQGEPWTKPARGRRKSRDHERSPLRRLLLDEAPSSRRQLTSPAPAEALWLRAEREEGDRLRRLWKAFQAQEAEEAAREEARRAHRAMVLENIAACIIVGLLGVGALIILVGLLPWLLVLVVTGLAALRAA